MNFKQEFYNRKEEFYSKVKDEMFKVLNESCASIKDWDATWSYQDGYFIADSAKHDTLFILRGDFESYIFDVLVTLPATGHPTEQMVYGYEDVAGIIENEIDNNFGNED
jgi:hypothetical protein